MRRGPDQQEGLRADSLGPENLTTSRLIGGSRGRTVPGLPKRGAGHPRLGDAPVEGSVEFGKLDLDLPSQRGLPDRT